MCVDATERNWKKSSIRKRAALLAVVAGQSLNTGWQSCYTRAL